MKDTILLTGAAGMLGHHIGTRLQDHYNLVGIDDLSGGRLENLPPLSRFIEMSCLDAPKVERLFKAYQPRFVIHCAAMAAENLSHNCRIHTYTNNLVGEATIRNAAIRGNVECMVSMSSIAVMGHQTPPFDEETHPAPADPYGVAKLAGEMDAECAKEFFDLNYVVFRCHNVLGTKQSLADRHRNVASIFIRAIVENNPYPVFSDGEQTRAFTPVSYAADVIAASVERRGTWNTVFNLGVDESISINQLADLLDDIVGYKHPRQHHEARKEAVHANMRHDRVRAAFPDITPTEDLRAVLTTMLEDARSNPLPPIQKGPEIEIQRGLPSIWSVR